VKIKVNVENPEEFTVKLKIPSWSENTQLADGDLQLPHPQAGKYAEIKKTWQPDDEINLTFDMRCKLIDAPQGGSTPNGDKYKALRYGALVLCRNSEIDPDYNKPVTIIADKNGFVDTKPTTNATALLYLIFQLQPVSSKCFPTPTSTAGTAQKSKLGLPYRNKKYFRAISNIRRKIMQPNKSEERVLIYFDYALKRLLRNKSNYDVLEGFLSVLLQTDVKVKSIVESESNKEHATDKYNKVILLNCSQFKFRLLPPAYLSESKFLRS
jgi:hypothetical protein